MSKTVFLMKPVQKVLPGSTSIIIYYCKIMLVWGILVSHCRSVIRLNDGNVRRNQNNDKDKELNNKGKMVNLLYIDIELSMKLESYTADRISDPH